jgi:hypothetical protein
VAAEYAADTESVGCPEAQAVSQQTQAIKPAEKYLLLFVMDRTP